MYAQAVSGGVQGSAVAPDGSPLAGVVVSIEGSHLPLPRAVETDAAGRFRLADLPVGEYTVRLQRLGVRTLSLTDVPVRLDRTTSLGGLTLETRALDLPPLVVRGRPLAVDPTSTGTGGRLVSAEYDHLPVGRDYKTLVALLPQANESVLGDGVNVGGSTGLENMYYIEGVNVTDVYRGRTGTDLPYNFVEAVEVKQGGYEARYGQALGGLVNVVTRSGTADFRLEGFGFFSGSALAADPQAIPNTLDQASFTDFDLGVSASGPLAGDRVTWFAAYNPRFVRRDLELPGLGLHEASLTRHMFAGKLRWRAGRESDLAVSVFGDPTTERRVSPAPGVRLLNADPVLTSATEGGLNGAVQWTARPTRRLGLSAFVGVHGRSENARGATELGRSQPSYIDRTDLPRIVLSGGNGTDQAISSSRISARVSTTLDAGAHALEGGLEVQGNRLDVRNHEDPGQVARLEPQVYRSSVFIQDFTVRNRVLTAYVQDGWDVSGRVRLNLGLRWDAQFLIDQSGSAGQSITDQLQPRVGVVVLPDREGRHKLSGHVGRFYQQLALFWSTIGLAGFDQRQEFTSADPTTGDVPVDSTLVLSDPDQVRGGTDGLRGEHHDEVVVGWEWQAVDWGVVGVRGVHRVLRESITAAFTPQRDFVGGNPGRDGLEHLPASRREYTALEVTFRARRPRWSLMASYVLSNTRGNYPGLFVSEAGGLRGGSFGPNNSQSTYFPAQGVNAQGPLPNDRPHVFKIWGSGSVTDRLRLGASFTAQSGIPLSELGRVTGGFNAPLFLTARGTEGRTPATWDLNLRLSYGPWAGGTRVILDLLHLGNPQAVVNVDQRRFNGARGSPFDPYERLVANQVGERPGFGSPVAFQPPFQLRLGLELAR